MKLVIDCFKLVKGKGKSIGIYNLAYSLVRELSREHEITVLGNKLNREDFDIPGVSFVCIDKNPEDKLTCVIWELYTVTRYVRKLKIDKVFFPRGFTALKIFAGGIKQYPFINDMIPFYYDRHFPGALGKKENLYITMRLKASAKTAYRVLTNSEASKNDTLEIAGVSPDKIDVVYLGCNPVVMPEETECSEREYYVAVTSSLPHKNPEGIVRSYECYCRKMGENARDLKIIGIPDVEAYNIPDEIKSKISCIKYIEKNEDMHAMIARSKGFLFMSRIEGFGFPPLEAMQLGVPVVSADSYSLKEVVADCGILVNSEDYEAAAEGLKSLHDEALCGEYVRKGFENVKRFDWKIIVNNFEKALSE